MNGNWIKIYRSLLDWEWYKTPNMFHFFSHCLLKANYKDKRWQGIVIPRGSFITSRATLAHETGLSEQQIRTCIERLKSTSELTSKTTNRFTLLTVVKYEDYQQKEELPTSESTSHLTNKQPASNQPATTTKEIKNNKEDKNIIPAREDFLRYCSKIIPEKYASLKFSIEAKYDTWVADGWKDGNGKPIKNWKNKINTVIPYLKPFIKKSQRMSL